MNSVHESKDIEKSVSVCLLVVDVSLRLTTFLNISLDFSRKDFRIRSFALITDYYEFYREAQTLTGRRNTSPQWLTTRASTSLNENVTFSHCDFAELERFLSSLQWKGILERFQR